MKGFAVLLLMIVILVPAALQAQPHDMKSSEGRAEGPASSQYRERLAKLTGTSPQPRTEGVKPVIPYPAASSSATGIATRGASRT